MKQRAFYLQSSAPSSLTQHRSSALNNLETAAYIASPSSIHATNSTIHSNALQRHQSHFEPTDQNHPPNTYQVTYVTIPAFALPAGNKKLTDDHPRVSARQVNLPPPPTGFQDGPYPLTPLANAQPPLITNSNSNNPSVPIAFMPPGSGNGYGGQEPQTPSPTIAVMPPGPAGGGYGGPPPSNNNGQVCNTCRPPPVCSQPLYTAIIPENSPIGTSVLKAAATGQGLQWTVSDTAFERFSITPTTGEVLVAGSLKRRARAAMEFKIRATDVFGLVGFGGNLSCLDWLIDWLIN